MAIERRHHGHVANAAASQGHGYNGNVDDNVAPSNGTTTPNNASKTRRLRQKKTNCIQSSSSSSSGNLPTLGVWSSRALLLFVAAIYSTNFACIKYLETVCYKPPCDHDPAEASFCRFLVSALVCLPILISNRRQIDIIQSGFEVGFWVSCHYVCQAESLEYIGAGKCAFICALEVVTVPLFAGFFLGKPIRMMSLVSAAIALFGVAILENLIPIGFVVPETASPANPVGTTIFGIGKGDILALGQPLTFGYAMMRIEYHIERFSHVPNRVLTLTAAQCVTVFLFSFAWLLYDSAGHFPDLSYMIEPHRLLTLGWTGVITTVVAIILQGIALQKASAADAALIFSSDPVWSSLFAGWLLNESLSPTTYVGGAFILTACVIGSVSSARASAAEPRRPSARNLKHKVSTIVNDEESLLPFPSSSPAAHHDHHQDDNHDNDFSAPTSVHSMNDVRQFPVRMNYVNGNSSSPTSNGHAAHDKIIL